MTGSHAAGMPRGPRDTRTWYRDADPMAQVDPALVTFVSERAGRRVLDLGCGLGGYSRALADRGFDCVAFDVVRRLRRSAPAGSACTPTASTASTCRSRTERWTR